MAAKHSVSTSMKEYLKRYESNTGLDRKKKRKSKTRSETSAVLVVDVDPVWAKPIEENKEEEDSADEEKPLIDEDIEVKRMRRLEQIRARRHYNAISEDGSGWVSVSDVLQNPISNVYESADMSPPRKCSRKDTPSPENRAYSEVPEDISPPRRGRRSPQLDLSPPRKSYRKDTPSPENNRANSEVPEDISPPRRARRSSPELDLSPLRQRRKQHAPSLLDDEKASQRIDLSPPRRGKRDKSHDLVSDLSPTRKSRKEISTLKEKPKTGLVSGRDIKEEITKTRKDDWKRFQEMDPSISGRGAEAVYRDKVKGVRISKEEFDKSQKKEEKPKEKKLEWGKGLAQKREAEARVMEMEMEKDKPFARTRDDPELDKMLKETVRWGDPMAHLVKKSQFDQLLPNLGDSEKMTESGFIIPQEIPSHSWIKRGLEAAPNRYGIRPGRHWDGVDRSNGSEKQMFKRTNEKQATQREAYMWSVSEM